MNFDPHSINSKWIIDQNIKHKTIKLLAENIRENPCDHRLGKEFLYNLSSV